jgi:hypothetical protein
MFSAPGRKELGMQSFAVYGNGLTTKIALGNQGPLKKIVAIRRISYQKQKNEV